MDSKFNTFFTALMGLSSIQFIEVITSLNLYEITNNVLHLLINGAQFAIGAITLYKLVKPSKKKQ